MAEDREESGEGSDLYTAKGERRQFVKHSYTDYAQEDDGPLSKKDEAILQQYDENRVAGPFPLKLHIILKILEEEGKDGEFVFGFSCLNHSVLVSPPRHQSCLLAAACCYW